MIAQSLANLAQFKMLNLGTISCFLAPPLPTPPAPVASPLPPLFPPAPLPPPPRGPPPPAPPRPLARRCTAASPPLNTGVLLASPAHLHLPTQRLAMSTCPSHFMLTCSLILITSSYCSNLRTHFLNKSSIYSTPPVVFLAFLWTPRD